MVKQPNIKDQKMLSKVFDKVFYKTYNSKLCKHCGGDGQIEVEEYFPRGFNNDIGIIKQNILSVTSVRAQGRRKNKWMK